MHGKRHQSVCFFSLNPLDHHESSSTIICYLFCFKFQIMLNQHIKKSHPDAPLYTTVSYKCRQCRALCPSFEVLRNHFRDKHPHVTVFRCPHCDVTLKTKKSLKAHFKVCSHFTSICKTLISFAFPSLLSNLVMKNQNLFSFILS